MTESTTHFKDVEDSTPLKNIIFEIESDDKKIKKTIYENVLSFTIEKNSISLTLSVPLCFKSSDWSSLERGGHTFNIHFYQDYIIKTRQIITLKKSYYDYYLINYSTYLSEFGNNVEYIYEFCSQFSGGLY